VTKATKFGHLFIDKLIQKIIVAPFELDKRVNLQLNLAFLAKD
jgi:hypothetical protein